MSLIARFGIFLVIALVLYGIFAVVGGLSVLALVGSTALLHDLVAFWTVPDGSFSDLGRFSCLLMSLGLSLKIMTIEGLWD